MGKGLFVCLQVSVAGRHVGHIGGHGRQPSHGSGSGKMLGYHYTYDDHKQSGGHFLVMSVSIEKGRFAPAVRRDQELGLTTVPSATDSGWIRESWMRSSNDQDLRSPCRLTQAGLARKENTEGKAQVLSGGTIRFLTGEEANELKTNC